VLRKVAYALGFVWTLPNTLIGLVFGAFTFTKPRWSGGCILFDRHPRGFNAFLRRIHRAAMTLGVVMMGNVRIEGRLRYHEDHHVRQSMWLGPLFVPVYLVVSLFSGYHRHPMEKAAERAATRTAATRMGR
jgi:hypothetical protein